MLKCDVDFIALAQQFVANSGRGPQHHGHYEMCLENPLMKYSLLEFGMDGVDIQANIGLCLPRSCPDKLIAGFFDEALKITGTGLNVLWINSDT